MMDLPTSDSAVLVIDVQERFQAAIPSIGPDREVGRACHRLIAGAGALGVPVLLSEQYPKGLGRTLPHLAEAAAGSPCLAKTHFSACDDAGIAAAIAAAGRSWWVLCGIEAHVCVLATAADLLASGRRVVIAGDAVDSRRPEHREQALLAARDLGALVLPAETVLFRWLRQAQGEAFKRIAGLVR